MKLPIALYALLSALQRYNADSVVKTPSTKVYHLERKKKTLPKKGSLHNKECTISPSHKAQKLCQFQLDTMRPVSNWGAGHTGKRVWLRALAKFT